jgi:hypothetical protein
MNARTMNFSVDAKCAVEHARGLVLEHNWRGAISFLMDTLDGMTLDLAVSLLKGEITLRNEGKLLATCAQDPEDQNLTRYLHTAAWQKAGYYFDSYSGEFYQPYAEITSFNKRDASWARDFLGDEHEFSYTAADYLKLRARFHMESRDSDLVFFDLGPNPVLFKRVQGPAFWVQTYKSTKDALAAFLLLRSLTQVGDAEPSSKYHDWKSWQFYETEMQRGRVYVSDTESLNLPKSELKALRILQKKADNIAEARSDEAREKFERESSGEAEDLPKTPVKQHVYFKPAPVRTNVQDAEEDFELTALRLGIQEQADKTGGFMELLVQEWSGEEHFIKVPMVPFMKWASRDIPMKVRDALPEWKPVCPQGMKMPNDNPLHTDWWVGCGLNPRGAYDMQHPVNRAAYRFSSGLAYTHGADFVKLAGKGVAFGQVFFPKPNEAVPAGAIAVVPNAGVDYEIALFSACKSGHGAVICEVGGKLAHLATVARESQARLVLVDNAMKTFVEGEFVSLNLETGKLLRHDTFLTKPSPRDD